LNGSTEARNKRKYRKSGARNSVDYLDSMAGDSKSEL